MNYMRCDRVGVVSKVLSAAAFLTVCLFAGTASAATTKGVWWWRGSNDAINPAEATRRLDFLSAHGVDEIYFCADLRKVQKETQDFVRKAHARGMRVALLAGDVSWIHPGSRGFAVTLDAYLAYQRAAKPDEKFYALHLDVEPHQDAKLPDARKWQLYADFVLRAAADIHAAGEKVEWDIPFWLDGIRVTYGYLENAPLLEVVMSAADGVALMSYRDTAEATLDVSKAEIALAKKRNVRVVLGAETGETGEGSVVTYFEEGAAKMNAELAKVSAALDAAKAPAGAGIAIHHLGGWEKLVEKEKGK